MTTTQSKKKVLFTDIPQWIVDECLSRKDAAYHEIDTIAVFMNVQKDYLEMRIEKLNSTEYVKYSLH